MAKISITRGAIQTMNHKQLKALKENVLADGQWEGPYEIHITRGILGEDLIIYIGDMIVIGIEDDGYTHS